MQFLTQPLKRALTLVGARMSGNMLHRLQMAVGYLAIGRWMKDNGFAPKRVPTRNHVFAEVARDVSDKRVLYLEFGVFKGKSLRWWSEALKHPAAMLHGFDSFEGLPEDFDGAYAKGAFAVEGQVPDIGDPRVRFFKGWFEDTLPKYEVPPHDVLVINLDADLYSSTKTVLDHLERHIVPGTYIYFDELSRVDHEPRAFSEFMSATGKQFEIIVAEQSLNTAFFRCVRG